MEFGVNMAEKASEDVLRDRLTELLEIGNIDAAIEALKENTGRGKIIDPADTPKLESFWGSVGAFFLERGKLENTRKVCQEMLETLLKLQERENTRYHKGLSLYNIGNVLFRQAFQFYLYSFIEDTINQKNSQKECFRLSPCKVSSRFLLNGFSN